jgi:hypothetical protein
MPRGGSRQGTPGKGYSNRTDLMASTKPPAIGQVDTAASGGMSGAGQGGPPPMPQGQPMPSPDDTPMLTDPTQRPDEPITAGLPMGPGDGPSIDNRRAETASLQRYLPILRPYLDRPDVEDSVRMLYRYIRSA